MATEGRKALGDTLAGIMERDDRVVVVGADLDKSDGLFSLRDKFPDRTFSAGIAEQNMAGIGAGLAAQGFIPLINTFAAFATRRICDQVAVSICFAESNVKIIGTDPGIAAELNGGTHMAFEDIGVMRSIPGITIIEPSDSIELAQAVKSVIEYEGPVYFRMNRKSLEDVHDAAYEFEMGKADILRAGNDVTVLSSGMMVCETMRAAAILEKQGISAEVINIHTIKPIDKEAILKSVEKTGIVVTAENHNIIGGLRSAVAETLTDEHPVRIIPVGVNDMKGEVGTISYLREQFGLDTDSVVTAIRRAVDIKGNL
jgi:transketolase